MCEKEALTLKGPHVGLKGEVSWQVLNGDGSLADKGGHMNLILDHGLDMLAKSGGGYPVSLAQTFAYCVVGIGNSTPIISQLALDSEKARTANYLTSPVGACGSYQIDYATLKLQRTFDFPLGALDSGVDGPYAEVGFSPSGTPGNNLFSRSLFKDGGGAPITVSVLPSQQLRVTYSLTIVFDMTTWTTGSVNITGLGSVTYKSRFTSSPLSTAPNPTTPITWPAPTIPRHQLFSLVRTDGDAAAGASTYLPLAEPSSMVTLYPYFAALSPSTVHPDETTIPALTDPALPWNLNDPVYDQSGTTNACTTTGLTVPAYIDGTFYQDQPAFFSLSQANFNISWLYLRSQVQNSGLGAAPTILFFFPTPIPKDNLHTLTINFRRTWGRI